VLVLLLDDAILLGHVRASHTMANALVHDVARQMMLLATPLRLKGTDFGIKKSLSMFLKQVKSMLNIRLAFEKVDPSVTSQIIQENHIIFETPNRQNSRPLYIGVHKFERGGGYMSRIIK
jgi:hypothetical protein